MKLYTEEQVRSLLNKMDIIYSLEDLTPIELPSDEEIGVIALNIANTLKDGLDSREEAFYLAGFQTCAKWMKDLIKTNNL